jgi:hypothetical protein
MARRVPETGHSGVRACPAPMMPALMIRTYSLTSYPHFVTCHTSL